MNLWEAYDKINGYLNEKLFAIPPYPCVSGNMLNKLLVCLEHRIRTGEDWTEKS